MRPLHSSSTHKSLVLGTPTMKWSHNDLNFVQM